RAGAEMVDRTGLAEPHAAARLAERERIAIDDADRAVDERNLLHLYNLLVERRGSLLLTAVEPPSRWPLQLADLRSRLAALPVVAIRPADDALVQAVLVKLFTDRQIRVDPELIMYLAARLDRSLAVAADAVNILDRAALAARRALTVPFARDTLRSAGLLS
ncbi:MAG TPA: DnaA/Hda family protein, partial [Alphaproteobacteria bacterium]|nr:DnaA/Hda family protein [Alphaproteobacteria bacterium]